MAEAPVRGLIGNNYKDRDYIKDVMKTGKPVFEPLMGRFVKLPVMITAVPLFGVDGSVQGVLCGAERIDSGNPFHFAGEVHNGKTGGYHIISLKDGVYVSSTDPRRVLEPAPAKGTNALYDRRLQGYLGQGIALDSKGVEIFSSAAKTSIQDWLVIVYIPTSEALAPLNGASFRVVTGAVAVSLLVGLLIWIVLRRELAPLESAARHLGETGADGLVTQPFMVTGSSEVRLLLGNFNLMREQVLKQNETIREERDHLALSVAELTQAEDRIRKLLRDEEAIQSSDIVGFIKVKERKYIWVNQAFSKMFGYTQEEIIGQSVRVLYSSDESYTTFAEAAYPVITGGGVFRTEVQYQRKDGKLGWYEVSGEAICSGKNESVWATIDITDRKQGEQALRDSEQRFRRLFHEAPVPLCFVNKNGVFVDRNIRFEHIFGYNRVELQTLAEWWSLAYPDPDYRSLVLDTWNAAVARATETGTDIEPQEYCVTCKDGEVRTILISGITLGEDFLATFFDVTDRKLAEEGLRKLNSELEERVAERTAELEQTNRELDDFAYIASHDLKEPLRGLHNYASFLREDYGDILDDEGKRYLERMQRLVERLTALIDRLLAYSRLGHSELPTESVALDSVLDEVVEDLMPFLAERDIELVRETPLPVVTCNSTRVGEVFQNLITNGAKYNDKPAKRITLGCDMTQFPVFYVRDNGIGIAAQHQESIFRIFKRLHELDKYGGGTGAGLTIVKKIIERHGGRIWLESAPGVGTTFYFTLGEEP
jgi:PAS domain S-box-containing protein